MNPAKLILQGFKDDPAWFFFVSVVFGLIIAMILLG